MRTEKPVEWNGRRVMPPPPWSDHLWPTRAAAQRAWAVKHAATLALDNTDGRPVTIGDVTADADALLDYVLDPYDDEADR